MTVLARWVQGIHMNCPKCGIKQGMINIHNNDQSGLTEAIVIECTGCHGVLARWEYVITRVG